MNPYDLGYREGYEDGKEAAQAAAVPDGYVLCKKEPVAWRQTADNGWVFHTVNPCLDNATPLYAAAEKP